jgi:O-antigen ligase
VSIIIMFAVVSVPFSVWPSGSFNFITSSYSKTLIFFFLVIGLAQHVDALERIVWSLIASGSFLSISLLMKTGQDRKSASMTYDPNDLAFTLVIILPFAYYLMKNRSGFTKVLLCSSIAMMILANIGTASRGGFLGLIAIGLGIFIKTGRRLSQAVLPIIAVTILLSAFAPASYWERMSTITRPGEDYNTQISSGRIEVWKRGVKLMVTNPVLGVGGGNFDAAEAMINGMKKWTSPHNSFVQIGAELGVIVLVLFIKLILGSLRTVKECRLGGVVPDWLLDSVEVGFYGYIVAGFFLSQAYSVLLYLLVAITVICRGIHDVHKLKPTLSIS